MTDREALLAAIRQFPDDDTPRLVFADWLDECAPAKPRRKGRDHAAFIRAQIESGAECYAWKQAMSFTRWTVSGERRTRGRADVVHALLPGLVYLCDFCMFTFRRGFMEIAQLSARDWFRSADMILKKNPLRKVRLATWPMPHDLAGIEPASGEPAGWDVPDTLAKRWPDITFLLPTSQTAAVPPAE